MSHQRCIIGERSPQHVTSAIAARCLFASWRDEVSRGGPNASLVFSCIYCSSPISRKNCARPVCSYIVNTRTRIVRDVFIHPANTHAVVVLHGAGAFCLFLLRFPCANCTSPATSRVCSVICVRNTQRIQAYDSHCFRAARGPAFWFIYALCISFYRFRKLWVCWTLAPCDVWLKPEGDVGSGRSGKKGASCVCGNSPPPETAANDTRRVCLRALLLLITYY